MRVKLKEVLPRTENWGRLIRFVMDLGNGAERAGDGALLGSINHLTTYLIALIDEEVELDEQKGL